MSSHLNLQKSDGLYVLDIGRMFLQDKMPRNGQFGIKGRPFKTDLRLILYL